MKKVQYYKTQLGNLGIVEENGFITEILYAKKSENAVEEETLAIKKAHAQLEEYFTGKRKSFDFPLNPKGTEFQKKVWNALSEIPYGKTVSYKDIATRVGNPKASRAVGMANNKNPLMIIVPCHRVVGSNGAMVGYAGGLDVKEKLLKLEGVL